MEEGPSLNRPARSVSSPDDQFVISSGLRICTSKGPSSPKQPKPKGYVAEPRREGPTIVIRLPVEMLASP